MFLIAHVNYTLLLVILFSENSMDIRPKSQLDLDSLSIDIYQRDPYTYLRRSKSDGQLKLGGNITSIPKYIGYYALCMNERLNIIMIKEYMQTILFIIFLVDLRKGKFTKYMQVHFNFILVRIHSNLQERAFNTSRTCPNYDMLIKLYKLYAFLYPLAS